jgi:urease accessory protein
MDALNSSGVDRPSERTWPARLELEFAGFGPVTRLVHRAHEGPLRVQRPFYPEDNGTCHAYLLHPPGGVVGGDQLQVKIQASAEARAVVTNPAATKLYRSDGRVARIRQAMSVSDDSFLEWLPQETIVFSGANAEVETTVHLDPSSQFLGWEVLCLGRPAANERFTTGSLVQRVEVWRDNLPLYLERSELGPHTETARAAWGLGGEPVLGTMLIATDRKGVLDLVRGQLAHSTFENAKIASTELDGVTLLRYVGPSVRDCWSLFVSTWRTTRPILSGTSASAPRIWSC